MKKYFLILALGFSMIAISQKAEIPAVAKSSFHKAHPVATNIKYEKEDGNYEVSFIENAQKMSVVINSNGKILETEIELKVSELPTTIQSYMKEHYKNSPLKGAAKITKPDGSINYEAAIKGKDVIFDVTGKFIKESKD
jgi:antitoxin component YwqK of YwqJK toxin-antitoxin module